ncbi:MAG: DNA-deoxyinosine glycosylase [Allobaculum sp.]|nr:DNA-deoxyinosine glycosylase [Allobaculum sp.]
MFLFGDLQPCTALEPVIFSDTTTLILVSMPGMESLREKFYFMDTDSCFWPLMALIYRMPILNKEDKLKLLQQNHLGIWSIIKSCLRYKSRDDTLEDIVLNDMQPFLAHYPNIKRILCTSHEAMRLLQEADPKAALLASYVPTPSKYDLWFESVEKLVPEYKKALGLVS